MLDNTILRYYNHFHSRKYYCVTSSSYFRGVKLKVDWRGGSLEAILKRPISTRYNCTIMNRGYAVKSGFQLAMSDIIKRM